MPSMTRRTKTARADRREEILTKIHDAIATLTAGGESFTEVSVERIVAQAGIARSTFYVYFADKGELLRALGSDVLPRLYDGARGWFEKGEDATRDDIARAMRALIDAFLDEQVIMTALAETAVYDPEVREMYEASVADFIASVRKLIQRGQRSRRFRDMRAVEVAAAISWMIERTTLVLTPGARPRELDQIAAGLADVIWGAIYLSR
jgi:TetR/AcrR family transcriptional regulator, ethionamide resistance regulator